MPKNAQQLADEIEGMWTRAEREGRDLTAGERAQMEQLIEAAKSQHSIEQQIKSIGRDVGGPLLLMNGEGSGASGRGGPGDVFVKSAAYQRIASPSGRGQTWTTAPVEVSSVPLEHKGTLTQTTGGGPGGGLIPPFYLHRVSAFG
jgi:hypothetical protein